MQYSWALGQREEAKCGLCVPSHFTRSISAFISFIWFFFPKALSQMSSLLLPSDNTEKQMCTSPA